MKRTLLCLILLAFSHNLIADEIYVCEGMGGRKIYSSDPCAGNQKLLKQEKIEKHAPDTSPAPPNPYVGELDRVVKGYIAAGNFERARIYAQTDQQWEWINEAEAKYASSQPIVIREEVPIPVAVPAYDSDPIDGWWGDPFIDRDRLSREERIRWMKEHHATPEQWKKFWRDERFSSGADNVRKPDRDRGGRPDAGSGSRSGQPGMVQPRPISSSPAVPVSSPLKAIMPPTR